MHIISRRRLAEFWRIHLEAEKSLKVWHTLCETTDFDNFAHLKRAIGKSVDKVGRYTVFDIGGNKFRLVTVIHYNRRKIYIRDVFTHADYDRKFRKKE